MSEHHDVYQPGEIVCVTLNDVPVVEAHAGRLRIKLGGSELVIDTDDERVSVTRRVPAFGPVVAGDLLRDRFGQLWFGTDTRDLEKNDPPQIRLVSQSFGDNKPIPVENVLDYAGPLTLVYRQPGCELSAADLLPGGITYVASADWNGGLPVRVRDAQQLGDGRVAVYFQDAHQSGAPLVKAVVPANHPLVRLGGDE